MSEHNFTLSRYTDGRVTLVLQPPAPVGGLDLVFEVSKRKDGDAIFSKYVSSGFNGMSGMTITSSGNGIIDIRIFAQSDMSGQDDGLYYHQTLSLTSGRRNRLSEGFLLME